MAIKKVKIETSKKSKKVDSFSPRCRLADGLPGEQKLDTPGLLRGPARLEWTNRAEKTLQKGVLTTPAKYLLLVAYCYLWGVFVFYATEIKLAKGLGRDPREKQSGGSSRRRLARLESAQRNCSKLLELLRAELKL
jgi:hypothetical protein